ncbi:MAG: dephospho-CoA kinase [Thalassobaculum sp.]|uniref:dephospho-CoA kinase n=1 Tax=Thalassobaculum sp. TaxID=2022740 RepID=UPI0032ECEB90
MKVLGLTGSIGMGKSTAAGMLRRLGLPVHDADAAVHRLLARGGAAVPAIDAAFPGVVRDGAVDRPALGSRVFGDPEALARLEAIVHPLVRRATARFLAACRRRRVKLAVLDVPLLLEGSGHERCDLVAVVSAPERVQRQRVMARPGMTESRLEAILAKQMPDAEKRRRADAVIPTGLGRAVTMRHLVRLVRKLRRNGEQACARSCSTRRRRGWTRRPATGSSRSVASS